MRSVVRKHKMNIKGQVGLDVAKGVMLTLLTLGIMAFVMVVVLTQLNTSNPAADGSIASNQSSNILANITGGVESFFSNAGTWFSLLAIVVIILIVAIVIFAVNRFGGSNGGL